LEPPIQRRPREPRADLPDPNQLPIVVGTYQQRAEGPRPAALTGRPTQDHAVLRVRQLDLPPVGGAPARLIPGAGPLGYDALEAEPTSHLDEVLAFALDVCDDLEPVILLDDRFKELASLLERQLRKVVPVQPEQVERDQRNRNLARDAFDLALVGQVHPLLA